MKVVYDFDYYFGEARSVIEVDKDKFTAKDAKVMLEFFCWSYDKSGDLIEEYLKKLAIQTIKVATEGDWNTKGTINAMDNMEGWPPLDGSVGLKLLDVTGYEFSEDELSFDIR